MSEASGSGRHAPRSSKACTRCRRQRAKCIPRDPRQPELPPCQRCEEKGWGNDCHFLSRGLSGIDRSYRQRRPPAAGERPEQPPTLTSPQFGDQSSLYDVLPPVSEVVEAIRRYTSSYFQLGFFHKVSFIERVLTDLHSVSPFLLISVCAVAAPFTPCLVERYRSKSAATDHFMLRAQGCLGAQMCRPSLQAAQAFLLLGIVEWGRGNGEQAWMLVGIASRMSCFMGLHKEATYDQSNPTTEQTIDSEIARRTFWAIVCHECLLAGQSRPDQLFLPDVDVLLPCDEVDFIYGREPVIRGGLPGSGAVAGDAEKGGYRSLFGSLVYASCLWSNTARHASQASAHSTPDRHLQTLKLLHDWDTFEETLPENQKFSMPNLRGMVSEGFELPFLALSLLARLSRIVLRRLDLSAMAADALSSPLHSIAQRSADDMVRDSEQLLSRVEACVRLRPLDMGLPPIMLFAVYMSGLVFSFVVRWPRFSTRHAFDAKAEYDRCVEILSTLSDAWTLASQWHDSLIKGSSFPESSNRPPMALSTSESQHQYTHYSPVEAEGAAPALASSTAYPVPPYQELANGRSMGLDRPLFQMSRRQSSASDGQPALDSTLLPDNMFGEAFDTFNFELSQFLASGTSLSDFDFT